MIRSHETCWKGWEAEEQIGVGEWWDECWPCSAGRLHSPRRIYGRMKPARATRIWHQRVGEFSSNQGGQQIRGHDIAGGWSGGGVHH